MPVDHERCPLILDRTSSIEGVPSACMRLCGRLMDNAIQEGPIEPYDLVDPDSHKNCGEWADVEFGCEVLQVSSTDPKTRYYSIVDTCVPCGLDLGSNTYRFECPNT